MCHGKHCFLGKLVVTLVVIGALNWGLVGIGMFTGSDLNVVHMLLGAWPTVEAVIYILVGIAGIVKIINCVTGACCGGMCGAGKGCECCANCKGKCDGSCSCHADHKA